MSAKHFNSGSNFKFINVRDGGRGSRAIGPPDPPPPPFPLLPLQHNFIDLLDLADSGEAVAWPIGFTSSCVKQYVEDYRLALAIGHYYTTPALQSEPTEVPTAADIVPDSLGDNSIGSAHITISRSTIYSGISAELETPTPV